MRSKIAVVGEKATSMGFRSVGFEVLECDTREQIERALPAWQRAVRRGVLTEQALAKAPGIIDKYKNARIPAIIPIPVGGTGTLGIGMANVRKNVERAVGADILFGGRKPLLYPNLQEKQVNFY